VTVAHQGAPKEWAGRQESNMKKLLGLTVLACMPVACGTVPTAPEMAPASQTTGLSSFTASGRGRVTIEPSCPTDPDWASIRGVTLAIARVGKTSVTLRAELLVIGDSGPAPCFNPIFEVTPSRRGISLAPELDPQEVTLSGPEGRYVVTAAAADQKGFAASLVVALPSEGR
jgi:hypothetical protein